MRYHVNIHYNYNKESELYLVKEEDDLERLIRRGCRVVIHDTKKDLLINHTKCNFYEGK